LGQKIWQPWHEEILVATEIFFSSKRMGLKMSGTVLANNELSRLQPVADIHAIAELDLETTFMPLLNLTS
jgi:hypothetical protein